MKIHAKGEVLPIFNDLSLKTSSILLSAALAVTGVIALDAQQTPATAQTASSVQNEVDYYAHLDGSQHFKATPPKATPQVNVEVITGTTFTVEAWVKPAPYVSGDTYRGIVSQNQNGNGGHPNRLFLSLRHSNGVYEIHYANGQQNVNLRPAGGVPADVWSHIAAVADGTSTTIYLNGVPVGVLSGVDPVLANLSPFTIGATGGITTHFFDGGIDQVKIWNGALTGAQLAISMHSWGSEGVTNPTLRAHYDFNDKSAANGKIFDRKNPTANGYHLDILGSPEFRDVKQVRELLGRQFFTFPRSYLTQIGGWRPPAGTTSATAYLVAGGGAGGKGGSGQGHGGGGGGAGGQVKQATVSLTGGPVSVSVGQGGTFFPDQTFGAAGQDSVLGSLIALGGGGGGNGSNDSTTGGSGGAGASYDGEPGAAPLGGTGGGNNTSGKRVGGGGGGAGGDGFDGGLADTSENVGGVGGIGKTLVLSYDSPIEYGAGGGGGLPTLPGTVGPAGGGESAGAGGSEVSGGVRGESGKPNRGGGGGGGPDQGGLGGNGGSGLVVVAFDFAAICAFGTNGSSAAQLPKLLRFPLGGQTSPRSILASDNTSVGAWYGKPVIVNGKLYTLDRGRSQLKRVNLDGSEIEYLGPLTDRVGFGAATDGRFVYAWGTNGIARFDTINGEYLESFIGRGVMNTRTGEMAFYRHDNGVGYLFITNGAFGLPALNRGRVYSVPVSGTDIPEAITGDHLFAESQLAGGTVQNIDVAAVTVAQGKLYWSQFVNTSPGGLIYEKEITTSNLPGGADQAVPAKRVAERTVATNTFTLTLASDETKIYWNRTNGSIQSLNLETDALTVESAVGLGSYVVAGILPTKDCALPVSTVEASLGEGGTLGINWNTSFESAATYRVEYRVNGGQWLVIDSAASGTNFDFAAGADPGDLVEVRVAVNAFNQVSEFTNAAPVDFEILAPQPPCEAPTSLIYEIPTAGEVVSFTLVSHGSSSQVVVAWGDGQVEPARTWGQNTNSSFSHTYQAPGTYTVSICGDYRGFANSLSQRQTHLVALNSWGESVSNFTRLFNAFYGAAKLVSVPTTFPPNVTDARQLFLEATAFNDPGVIGWNVSSVTSGTGMFRGATSFNQPIGGWNTSNFTAMNSMFFGASSFNQDLHNWDTSKVTTMFDTFREATAFNGRVDTWNTSKVTTMTQMFLRAAAFNQPLATVGSTWDVSNVTNMFMMFRFAGSFNQDLSSWNTGSVTDMASMFSGATVFNNGEAAGLSGAQLNWNTSNVTKMDFMFSAASAFNQPFGASWNTAKVTSFAGMFSNAESFNHPLDFEIDAITTASKMLDFSGVSDENYSTTVLNLKTRYENLPSNGERNNISLGAVDKTAFCNDPNAAVRFLADTAGWRITDKTDRAADFCAPQVTITADNASHVYGDPVPSVSYTLSVISGSLPSTDWLNDVSCVAVASGTYAPVESTSAVSGSYITKCIGPSGTGLGLNVTYADGTYSVMPRPITVAARNQAVFTNQALLPTSSADDDYYLITGGSLAGSDAPTFTYTYSAPQNPGVDAADNGTTYTGAGTKQIAIALSSTGVGANYTATYGANAILTVTAVDYIIEAKTVSKQFGDTKSFTTSDWTCTKRVETSGVTSKGACGADLEKIAVNVSSAGSTSAAAVGAYALNVSATPLPGLVGDVRAVRGTLHVTKRVLTVTPNDLTVAYGSAAPNYTYTVSGFAFGQSASTAAGYVAPTCSSGYVPSSPRGSELTITCSGGSAENYEFAFGATATLTVPSLSEVIDLVPQTLMLEPEEFETEVGFSFVLTPVAQVCFASLLLFDQNGNIVERDIEGNELRQQVLPGQPLSFNVPLIIGSYDYELKVDGNCDIATTSGNFAIQEFVAATEVGGGGYFGPIVSGASTSTIDTCKPTLMTLAGQRLDNVMAASVQGRLVRIADKRADLLVIEVPAGLTPATGVDLVIESSLGRLTVQSLFNIVGPDAGFSCAEVGEAAQFWTKRISPTEVKFYAKWPVGAGKIQFMLDGREIGWVRAASESDRKLIAAQGRSYFVRTVTLKPGKNRFEILVDGERVRRATYTGR
jgi:surface protein